MILIQSYYGEGLDKTGEVSFYGRILHVSVGRWFHNFHLWGARKGTAEWAKYYDEEVV